MGVGNGQTVRDKCLRWVLFSGGGSTPKLGWPSLPTNTQNGYGGTEQEHGVSPSWLSWRVSRRVVLRGTSRSWLVALDIGGEARRGAGGQWRAVCKRSGTPTEFTPASA